MHFVNKVQLNMIHSPALTDLCCAFCRRQEIVFIGAGMSEEAISKQLDTALLTPAEMSKYVENYKHIPDPPHPELTSKA